MFDDDRSTRLHRTLRDASCGAVHLCPVSASFAENERWVDRELAAHVEAWHGELLDPAGFTDADRARCHARLAPHPPVAPVDPEAFYTRWWITAQGREAGVLATARFTSGDGLLPVFSLSIDPPHRRGGVAADAIALAELGARAVGLSGVRMDVPWGWRDGIRYLLAQGFWARRWARHLTLQRGAFASRLALTLDGDAATLALRSGALREPLVRATRAGDRLGWERTATCRSLLGDPHRYEEAVDAEATLALHLALAGWPLVRTEAAWQRSGAVLNAATPESLLRRIVAWEAALEARGVALEGPRVPRPPR
jgi:hypothetical protein